MAFGIYRAGDAAILHAHGGPFQELALVVIGHTAGNRNILGVEGWHHEKQEQAETAESADFFHKHYR
jgi:hypothetical protein